MTISPSIPRILPAESSQNYPYLRELSMAYLEKIVSQRWTDFNIHDPGITMMEMFCYAITDLGLRTSYPLEDLLATQQQNLLNMHQQFASALAILPTCPVSDTDYRSLFITHVPGVKNAWLTQKTIPVNLDCTSSELITEQEKDNPDRSKHKKSTIDIRGLYHIHLEIEPSIESDPEKEEIIAQVRKIYHQNRNLGEDLFEISLIKTDEIITCFDLELEASADVHLTHARVLIAIEDYLSPPVQYYSLEEMMQKGYQPEEIFQAPILLDYDPATEIPTITPNDKGFLDPKELERSGLRKEVRSSDLIAVIMQVPGVVAVQKISLNYCEESRRTADMKPWKIAIESGKQPKLCREKSKFIFYKDLLPFRSDRLQVAAQYDSLRQEAQLRQQRKKQDLPMPLGEYGDFSSYTSLQHEFPPVYGIGNIGLDSLASAERKAQAKQLQAYLCFFDQILANYLAQLSNLKSLFSLDQDASRTYFAQAIHGVDDLQQIFQDYDALPNILNQLVDPEEIAWDRKNDILNHLLARFSEKFTDYVILMQDLYGNLKSSERVGQDKMNFLREYPDISRGRSKGFDYYNSDAPLWDSDNVSGLQKRWGRLMGLSSVNRQSLTTVYYQLYEEQDEDMISETRFRILDRETGKILLSSTTRYESREDAIRELEASIQAGMKLNHYRRDTTSDGRFYFYIIKEPKEQRELEDQIARRIEYFQTEEEREQAIEYLFTYLTETFNDEGMFLIEHLLLRPTREEDAFLPVCVEPDCTSCQADPYSFQVHIILPAYAFRFTNMAFRRYAEKVIRQELPVHIFPKICWIGIEQMREFEPIYRAWLEGHRIQAGEGTANPHHNPLLKILSQLYSIYPERTLHDCEDDGTLIESNSIILGQSQIGSSSPNE